MSASDPQSVTIQALRGGAAAVVCLVLVEALHLEHAGLAVWSTHMVMVQYAFTTFQKGVERALGRGFGILVALIIAALTRDAWVLGFVLEMLTILPLFYVYFTGRLSYTFLNAGLYLATMMEISRSSPSTAVVEGGEMFLAVSVGVGVAMVVSWITRGEQDVTIHTDGEPLWPIDRTRVLRSVMLALTVALVQLVTHLLDLSTSTALVSTMLITITPDYQSLLHKGKLRLAGAVLAVVFASATLVLLVRRPSLMLLMTALFLGTYLAETLARRSKEWSYAGVQMGLVLPMILVVPHNEFGSLEAAFARVGGALVAIGCSLVVGVFWAAVAPSPMPLVATPKPSA